MSRFAARLKDGHLGLVHNPDSRRPGRPKIRCGNRMSRSR